MLFTCSELQNAFSLDVKGVLHIGAHKLEERDNYVDSNWTPRVWIEANSSLIRQYPNLNSVQDCIIEAACWHRNGELLEFKVMSNSECSSILDLGLTSTYYPDVNVSQVIEVKGRRVDSLFEGISIPNFVNIDVQGSELQVLLGFGERLSEVDYVYCEVNKRDLYLSCTRIEQIDELLIASGFRRVTTRWIPLRHWGDALYVRPERIKIDKLKLYRLRMISVRQHLIGLLVELHRSLKIGFKRSAILKR